MLIASEGVQPGVSTDQGPLRERVGVWGPEGWRAEVQGQDKGMEKHM